MRNFKGSPEHALCVFVKTYVDENSRIDKNSRIELKFVLLWKVFVKRSLSNFFFILRIASNTCMVNQKLSKDFPRRELSTL